MFRRILVPIDGTAGSERAIPYAIGLAQALEAEVVICHIMTAPVATKTAAEERNSARYVSRIAERFRASGVAAKTLVRRGEAALEINTAAVDWNIDAIVMATRSRQRLQKLMLGSVADVVVSRSRLPVLLVSSRGKLMKPAGRAA